MSLFSIDVTATVHVHSGADVEPLKEALGYLTQRVSNMATKDDIKAAIAEESEEVRKALEKQKAESDTKIKELEDKIAAGNPVTVEDLEEIRTSVRNIYTAPGTPETPVDSVPHV